MTQFIANLNMDAAPTDDLFGQDNSSTLFADTDFFDFDMNNELNLDSLPGDFEASISDRKGSTNNWQAPSGTTSGSNFLDSKSHLDLNCASAIPPPILLLVQHQPFVFPSSHFSSGGCTSTPYPPPKICSPRFTHHAAPVCISHSAPPSHNRSLPRPFFNTIGFVLR